LSNEHFQEYEAAAISLITSSNILYFNGFLVETAATPLVTNRIRDSIWVIATTSTFKQRKGSLKNLYLVQGGFRYDLCNNKTWIQLGNGARNYSNGNVNPACIHYGWDGYTTQMTY
jgi:hypothetical protein